MIESKKDILNVLNPYLIEAGNNDYEIDFQSIIPMDEKLLEAGSDWYNWRVENWGTKWNGYDGSFTDDFTIFSFDTAWSPPLPVIRKLAELTGETFILEYIEEGMGFCGRYTAGKDGDYYEFYNDIQSAPEELLDALGYEPWEEDEEELV
jgi:hypothetical protein